jgi:hypothetical protein
MRAVAALAHPASVMLRPPPVENAWRVWRHFAGRRIFGGDFRPVAFEFFGDQLGKAGEVPPPISERAI